MLDLQAHHGDGWIEALADFYFTDRVTCDVADGCALPSLAGEVARSDAKTKTMFEKAYLYGAHSIDLALCWAEAAPVALDGTLR